MKFTERGAAGILEDSLAAYSANHEQDCAIEKCRIVRQSALRSGVWLVFKHFQITHRWIKWRKHGAKIFTRQTCNFWYSE